MYSNTPINNEDAKVLGMTGHIPMDPTPGVLGGSEAITDPSQIEVPLIHWIMEHWADPKYPLPTMIAKVKEYGRTYHVMAAQEIFRERNEFSDLIGRLKGQIDRDIEQMNNKDKEVEVLNDRLEKSSKAHGELWEVLKGVMEGEREAFRKGALILGIDPVEGRKKIMENREKEGAKSFTESFLNLLNSLTVPPVNPLPSAEKFFSLINENTKLKKDFQLKDIELQEARHKVIRMEQHSHTTAVTDWERNYHSAVAELQEARDKISRMEATKGPHLAIHTNQELENELKKVRTDLATSRKAFTDADKLMGDWQQKYLTEKKQHDKLADDFIAHLRALCQVFPNEVTEIKLPNGIPHFDIKWESMQMKYGSWETRSPFAHAVGGLKTTTNGPRNVFEDPRFGRPWTAEAKPANGDYRDLYHQGQQVIHNLQLEINQKNSLLNRLTVQLQGMDRLIADKIKVISEYKNGGYMTFAASQSLKTQAKMWKERYIKLDKDIVEGMGGVNTNVIVDALHPQRSGQYVNFSDFQKVVAELNRYRLDYGKRIEEINAVHHKMEDVYHLIKDYIPEDHNIDYWQKRGF